jgi:hypothetical protein
MLKIFQVLKAQQPGKRKEIMLQEQLGKSF